MKDDTTVEVMYEIVDTVYNSHLGRAMAQVVSRRPLTSEARVRALVSPTWDLWWTEWHWDRFFSEFFGFPLSIYHSTVALHTYIWTGGKNNRPIRGSSSET
jgi:hypothetical protein